MMTDSVFDQENDEISLANRGGNTTGDKIVEITKGKDSVATAGTQIQGGMGAGVLIAAIAFCCFAL